MTFSKKILISLVIPIFLLSAVPIYAASGQAPTNKSVTTPAKAATITPAKTAPVVAAPKTKIVVPVKSTPVVATPVKANPVIIAPLKPTPAIAPPPAKVVVPVKPTPVIAAPVKVNNPSIPFATANKSKVNRLISGNLFSFKNGSIRFVENNSKQSSPSDQSATEEKMLLMGTMLRNLSMLKSADLTTIKELPVGVASAIKDSVNKLFERLNSAQGLPFAALTGEDSSLSYIDSFKMSDANRLIIDRYFGSEIQDKAGMLNLKLTIPTTGGSSYEIQDKAGMLNLKLTIPTTGGSSYIDVLPSGIDPEIENKNDKILGLRLYPAEKKFQRVSNKDMEQKKKTSTGTNVINEKPGVTVTDDKGNTYRYDVGAGTLTPVGKSTPPKVESFPDGSKQITAGGITAIVDPSHEASITTSDGQTITVAPPPQVETSRKASAPDDWFFEPNPDGKGGGTYTDLITGHSITFDEHGRVISETNPNDGTVTSLDGVDGETGEYVFNIEDMRTHTSVEVRKPSCPSGQEVKYFWRGCECPSGKKMSPDKKQCWGNCHEGLVNNQTNGVCECPSGKILAPDSQSTCWNRCPTDQVNNKTTGECQCMGMTEEKSADGSKCWLACMGEPSSDPGTRICTCPANTVPSTKGNVCWDKCPEGQTHNQGSGVCECPPGQQRSGDGSRCMWGCPTGQQPDSSNQCKCRDPSQWLSVDGDTCQVQCYGGETYVNGRCKRFEDACRPGGGGLDYYCAENCNYKWREDTRFWDEDLRECVNEGTYCRNSRHWECSTMRGAIRDTYCPSVGEGQYGMCVDNAECDDSPGHATQLPICGGKPVDQWFQ